MAETEVVPDERAPAHEVSRFVVDAGAAAEL
jgi:hypothetical protein